jgi:hypothetical protein
MASVSSGTLAIVYFSILGIAIVFIWRGFRRRQTPDVRVVPILIALAVFLPWMYGAIVKNSEFYGGGAGGAVGMLEHGLWQKEKPPVSEAVPDLPKPPAKPDLTLFRNLIFGGNFLAIIALVSLTYRSWQRNGQRILSVAWIGLVLSMLIGQVGYSALTLAIPTTLLLLPTDAFRNYN